MTKKNLPNIPIYIGDWERDCNVLGLESEAAWMRIVFKLWTKGKQNSIKMSAKGLQNLWRCSDEKMREILDELIFNDIADISMVGDIIEFTCRRFVKENEISAIRSKAAKSAYIKGKTKAKHDQNESKLKAKRGQITDYETDNDNENEVAIKTKKGGVGEKTEIDPSQITEIEDPFPNQLTKFLEGPTAPEFFWEAFETLIDAIDEKNLFIDFESLENGKTNIEKAVRLFNLIKSHQKIPSDGNGLSEAVREFIHNLPEWYLDKFDLPLVVSKFDRIVNEINSKNKKDEKRKPDPRFDDRKSKFEGASKRRGTVKFT